MICTFISAITRCNEVGSTVTLLFILVEQVALNKSWPFDAVVHCGAAASGRKHLKHIGNFIFFHLLSATTVLCFCGFFLGSNVVRSLVKKVEIISMQTTGTTDW